MRGLWGFFVPLIASKVLSLGKTQINLVFRLFIRTFAHYLIYKQNRNGLHTTYRNKYECLFGGCL